MTSTVGPVEPKVSYAQNAEDIRVWRAFQNSIDARERLTYVDVGANEPRHLSITASLYDMGWSGLLIEADPVLAADLRVHRPHDDVVEMAASGGPGELTFYRVPGTGLGTLDESEAKVARGRGFDVSEVRVRTESLDTMLSERHLGEIHFISIDVEGAEGIVLAGLSLTKFRPWVICIEAVLPGTNTPSHQDWEPTLTSNGYLYATFDGVNRWYVAEEHAELVEAIATPFNAIDAGEHGWITADHLIDRESANRAGIRRAWQRELIMNDLRGEVPRTEYEKQIHELRTALITVSGSRTWRFSRKLAKVGKAGLKGARSARSHLPAGLERAIIRQRHLRHVTINMGHLTDPAYLGHAPADVVNWIDPVGLPAAPSAGLDLKYFSLDDAAGARAWLAAGPYDTDDLLDRRTDNHGDELGRVMAGLADRLALAAAPANLHRAQGGQVLFDARSLQSPAFGNRGIGRFAAAALIGARQEVGDDSLVLLIDEGLEPLPENLKGNCRHVLRVTPSTVGEFGALVQPSPMTASTAAILPLLHSDAHAIAIVFDFIPMHYPTVYLRHPAARIEYAAALDALALYDDFICISQLVKTELTEFMLGRPAGLAAAQATVAWPRDVLPSGENAVAAGGRGPIVVMTGDEPRKNTFGALAGIGAATAGLAGRDVVVIGMAGQQTRVHHWSIAAAMRPGEAVTTDRITDDQMQDMLRSASLVVVDSFDEGLSLPVIEAVRAGATVIASDIPAHRELIGSGGFLADPRSPRKLAAAIRRYQAKSAKRARAHAKQARKLARHRHSELETVIGDKLRGIREKPQALPPSAVHIEGRSLRVGIGTPWAPQRSGVADFSTTTTLELAKLCDVTVYTTAGADVPGTTPPGLILKHGPIEEIIRRGSDHDVFVTVLGNSHFHVPFLEAMNTVDAVVVAHDTRMVELYMAMRGKGGVEQVMLRGTGQRELSPALDDQIDDMRLLQNAGFWEVARRARMLILHSPSSAPRIAAETGVTPRLLPFANQRAPQGAVTEQMRRDARARLGFDAGHLAGTVHLASFGYVDVRTKMTDVVLESAAWLTQWGHRVSLHLAGAASDEVTAALRSRAQEAGIANFSVTGFLSDEQFRDHLLAVDIGLQLRISPLLGVSGPLSDLAAYGTASVASTGLAVDVDTPAYVDRLPDDVSPVMVAEALEYRIRHPLDHGVREEQRLAYLDRKSPRRYAESLLALLTE